MRDSSRPLGGGGTRARSASGGCSYGDAGGGFLSGEHKVRPYHSVANSTMGLQRGAAPLRFLLVPLSQRGIEGD